MILKNNFGTGKIGYLGKEGNNGLEDFGYAMGGLANLSDAANFVDGITGWEQKIRNNYEAKRIATLDKQNTLGVELKNNKSGFLGSNHVGPNGPIIKGTSNVALTDHPSLSDLSSGLHDDFWESLGMEGNALDFFTNANSLKGDWQMVGRSLHLGMKNLFVQPMQAMGSVLLSVGSFISFMPKTIFGFYKVIGR